jgi:predicted transcriptional regulator YdeE
VLKEVDGRARLRFPDKKMRLRILTWFIVPISVGLLGETTVPKKVHQDSFFVVGIEARTTNSKEMTGAGEIPKQWQKFFQDGIAEKIPSKIDGTIYAVYTDYASDRTGEYSFVIGVKVPPNAETPSGLVLRKIPAGDYAVVTSNKGLASRVVPGAWQQIWALEDKAQLGGARAYRADYEVYDQRATDPQNSQVDVYVGLK